MTDPPPGPELDALVAEKVMGRALIRYERQGYGRAYVFDDDRRDPVPPYSTDIAAAFDVVSFLRNRFRFRCEQGQADDWSVAFGVPNTPESAWHKAVEQTLPHAICLAALKAVEK